MPEVNYFEVATLADRRCAHTEDDQGCALWDGHDDEHLLCPKVVLETLDRTASYEQLTGQTLENVKDRWSARFAGYPPNELARDIEAELTAARQLVHLLDGKVSLERDMDEEQELLRHEAITLALGTSTPIWALYAERVCEAIDEDADRMREQLAAHGLDEEGWREDEPAFGEPAAELEQLLGLIDRMDGDPIWRFYADKRIWSALAQRERLRQQLAGLEHTPEDSFRQALVSMLNVLGDRSEPCPEGEACEGCAAESQIAQAEALDRLGYSSWQEFHDAEILRRQPDAL